MIEPQQNNDSTVQPASKIMSSKAVFAELFCSLAKHDRSLAEHGYVIQELRESLHFLLTQNISIVQRLNYLESKDDQINRLKDENNALRDENNDLNQMVDINSPDCPIVQDVMQYRYPLEEDQ